MIQQNIGRIALLATTLLVAIPSPVVAGQWADRTIITFSEPVKVPGATLPAGSYVFELVNPASSTDVVRITDKAGSKVYTVTHAVPTTRPERTEDVIVLFTPMARGDMPAIRGWYPAGGQHGHLFVYSKQEARSLADRAKSVVLSRDIENSNLQSGTIVVINPGGATTAWKQNEAVQREWDSWTRERRETVTPMIADPTRGQHAKVADIEDHPDDYFGEMVSLDGRVDEVYGPHLFELEEPAWGQPEGNVLVFLPERSLAAVRENDRVTVTGTLKRFIRADVIGNARWLEVDGIMDQSLDEPPVLVATRVVGGDNDRALMITTRKAKTTTPAGTPPVVTDIDVIANGDSALVGRRVALPAVKIHSVDRQEGFFIKAGSPAVFVMMKDTDLTKYRAGDAVVLEGIVLAMPPTLAADLMMPAVANRTIYLYADSIKSGR